jgi:hypothetical protein
VHAPIYHCSSLASLTFLDGFGVRPLLVGCRSIPVFGLDSIDWIESRCRQCVIGVLEPRLPRLCPVLTGLFEDRLEAEGPRWPEVFMATRSLSVGGLSSKESVASNVLSG